jgi:hypothetical protein
LIPPFRKWRRESEDIVEPLVVSEPVGVGKSDGFPWPNVLVQRAVPFAT